jgi:riboflavin synthase alpha subunit
MFTGILEETGVVAEIKQSSQSLELTGEQRCAIAD